MGQKDTYRIFVLSVQNGKARPGDNGRPSIRHCLAIIRHIPLMRAVNTDTDLRQGKIRIQRLQQYNGVCEQPGSTC